MDIFLTILTLGTFAARRRQYEMKNEHHSHHINFQIKNRLHEMMGLDIEILHQYIPSYITGWRQKCIVPIDTGAPSLHAQREN